MPRRSTAFATRSARCVNTRFTRRENCVRCLCIVSRRLPAYGRLPYLPRTMAVRLLRLPRLAAAPAGARVAARLARALPPLRPRPARRARLGGSPQPRARGRPAAWARAGGNGAQVCARARGRLRRRLRDRARVAAGGESCRRRPLHGRHGRDPAAAAEEGRQGAPAARLHRDRASRASRAAPIGADAAPLCAALASLGLGSRVQRARG